jgi:hypothetical protein
MEEDMSVGEIAVKLAEELAKEKILKALLKAEKEGKTSIKDAIEIVESKIDK